MKTSHSQTQRLLRKIDCARTAVLVVEDHDASRRLILELLRGAGFENLTFARDADEAIAQMQGHDPDVLLLDWGLPGKTGIELVREIRAAAHAPDPRFANPQVPIVMITARQRARDVTAARNAGINEFVIKPFSTSSLLKALASALTHKRQFIASLDYTGPDRRRRKAESYPGLLRRNEDVEQTAEAHSRNMFRESLTVELNAVRAMMNARGGLDRPTMTHMVEKLLAAERRAHNFRLSLIEQATRSLNTYIAMAGDHAEPKILDAHLDALIQLNTVPFDQESQAAAIVQRLEGLVARRRQNRKSLA